MCDYFALGKADIVYSEMYHVNEALYKKEELLSKPDYPYIIQIFGKHSDPFEKAAQYFAEHCTGIDINAGCPIKKVIKAQGGSFLLQDSQKLANLIGRVKKSVNLPVSVKIRLGNSEVKILEILNDVFSADPDYVTVHLRTASMMFSGHADYSLIPVIMDAYPHKKIIFNGDIDSPEKAENLIKSFKPFGIMIGRYAYNDPFVFSRIKRKFMDKTGNGEIPKMPDLWFESVPLQNIAILIGIYRKINNEKDMLLNFRKITHQLLKGLPESHGIKNKINRTEDRLEIINILQEYRKFMIRLMHSESC